MNLADIIGWIGSICFALCGTPQAWRCVQQGHTKGISPAFLWLWLIGELCYVAGVLLQFGFVAWMMTNYMLNIACVLIMLRYLLFPRNSS